MNTTLFLVVVNSMNFSIAAHARTLRRLGSFGSGFCFDNQIAFLLATDESAEFVEGFIRDETGHACRLTRAEVFS